jgi:hypothetical protein
MKTKHKNVTESRFPAVIEVARKYGWNGVNNSKFLAVFFDDLIKDYQRQINSQGKVLQEIQQKEETNNQSNQVKFAASLVEESFRIAELYNGRIGAETILELLKLALKE